ncbi:hypothetical protein HJD18_02155 [Thermoleophilia bacterium SCSIO 60948]|nr:hypothetical protein HJD18_02155 [Thermoleophilia bacterium SCSIO 60948]
MSFSAPPVQIRLLERLLPFACAGSAVLLFASEFMNTFLISESVRGGLCEIPASDRHLYALAVLAGFALIALVISLRSGSKPAAMAVAACGIVALVMFLAIDLPAATASGTLGEGCSPIEGSFAEASVDPQAGFWIALIGALGLAATGIALATFSERQLAVLGPKWLRGSRQPRDGGREGPRSPRPGSESTAPTGPFDADRESGAGDPAAARERARSERRDRTRRRRRPRTGEQG